MIEKNKEVVKLKTLEDLSTYKIEIGIPDEGIYKDKGFIKKEEIKELVINWLKEDKKVIERLHPDDVSIWTISMRGWMKRFNITEEDLK